MQVPYHTKHQRYNRNHWIDRFLWVLLVGILSSSLGRAQISSVHVTPCGPQGFPGTCAGIPATGSGNLIVIGWEMVQPATGVSISSITDNAGNVYTEAGAAKASYSNATVDLWYAKNSKPGATSITIQTSATVSMAAALVWEFSGADQTSPLDAVGVLNNQASTATPVSPSIVTTQANDVVVALVDVDNQVTGIASGNAFTFDSNLMQNGFAHLITSAAGTYFAQWNESPGGAYTSTAAAFKVASGGGTPLNACDLAAPFGVIDLADVTAAVNMTLGIAPCTANVEGPTTCTVVTVQRVINASQGLGCMVYSASGPPVITSSTSATGTVGLPFTYQIAASNSPTIFGATGLPGGLSVNTSSGLISGTPAASGTSSVALSATNGSGTGNATLTLTVNAPVSHSVTLNWVPSTSQNIAGYNVYRGTVSGGPYTKVTSALVAGTSYLDGAVLSGTTYFYVATAVDTSGNESAFSAPASAVIPTP